MKFIALKSPSPPLPEQKRIAKALSDIDELITALDKLITKKRYLKQGAMQQLLTGKTRLPGFTGDWEVKRLGEVGKILAGGTPNTNIKKYWDGNIAWCTPTDITLLQGKKYISKTNRTISNLGLINSAAELIPNYSLVVTTRATIGECAINIVTISTNQGFKNIVLKDDFNIDFIYYKLLTIKPIFILLSSGSTFVEISKSNFEKIQIPLPPPSRTKSHSPNPKQNG
jgi:type I restriction enzyme S subunit